MRKKSWNFKNNYIKIFIYGLILATAMILPFIVKGHGIFTMVDDFNYQQIPFNMLSNTSIKSGDTGWNWYTELGGQFIGGYSFYTLGSPFFWLSLLFPASVFPYLIGPLLILKYSVAALTSYAYIQRFINYKPYAMIGALVYSFSGFQFVNLMFNHFHDVVALFPLLLIGVEVLVEKKKFVAYTLSVALLSTLSFFFFEGQIIYLIIYFCVRFLSYDFKRYIKIVPKCLAGGLIGMGISGFLLVPSILFTLNNPRVGNGFFQGMDALIYEKDRYLILLKAFFMPAEVPQQMSAIIKYNFLSCEMYLPLIGGVLAVIYACLHKDWISRLLKVSLIFVLIPALNSLFAGFNTIPYFRWLYMPILILALASAKTLDERHVLQASKVKRVFIGYGVVFVVMVLFIRFFPWNTATGTAVYRPAAYWLFAMIAAAGVLWAAISVNAKIKDIWTARLLLVGVAGCALILGWRHILRSQEVYADESTEKYCENFLDAAQNINLPEGDDYRIYIDQEIGGEIPEYLTSNLSLILRVPSVASYHSNISPSIYTFYESMGIERMNNVATVIPENVDGMLDFLSVKYELTRDSESGQLIFKENENYLPFGLEYEYYILRSDFMSLTQEVRANVLAKAIVVEEEQVESVADYLKPLSESELEKVSAENHKVDIEKRRSMATTDFYRDNSGFGANYSATADTYIYFTVPYDAGWKATVNGEAVEITEANGFMMIPVKTGDNEIHFDYETPGLKVGILLSFVSVGIVVLLLISKKVRKNRK